MSRSAIACGGGPDFSLPDEVLAVIPTDPYDQLDLARKITSMAIASRVSNLEAEVSGLRQKLLEKDHIVHELEDKVAYLERAFQEADSSLKNVSDENVKLIQERDSLAITAKKLSRDFQKLEAFKRQLMQSLNDDNASQTGSSNVRTVPEAYPDRGLGNLNEEVRRLSSTLQMSPRLTPSGTPKISSTSASPRHYSTTSSPKLLSGAASPTASHYNAHHSLPSWCSSSQQSSGANSPSHSHPSSARPPRIDGKEFFRQVRSRLSYEQFSSFLANIKELNARKQTREETLTKAEEIFGTENKDLYILFQGIISRTTVR